MKRIIIIGCGPAGMTSALYALDNAQVTILDHMDKGGKKLLLTGNGRCNLSNEIFDYTCYNCSDENFVKEVFEQFGYDELMNFFEAYKIHIKSKKGYIYPVNEQALSVNERLKKALLDGKVKLKYNQTIRNIRKEKNIFYIETDGYIYEADSVVLACGGASYPQTGSDGSGYELARKMGHKVLPHYPVLTALKTDDTLTDSCAGVRCDAHATLLIDGIPVKDSKGELQIIAGYLSGIMIYELSSIAVIKYTTEHKVDVRVDFLPDISFEPSEDDLETLLNSKLLSYFKDCKIKSPKEYTFSINGYKGFDYAQATGGGVDVSYVNSKTMESKLVKGLYFAGEMLDVDGKCGGYNLSFAFCSGAIAGYNAKQEDNHDKN